MISMMYLVLTALLALNVSADILDAFAIVNDGLEKTNASTENKIEDYYRTFEQQYNKQPEKVQQYWDKAQLIREKTDAIINYIENEIKVPMVLQTENIESVEMLLNPKDTDKPLVRNTQKADPKNRRVFYEFNLKNIDSKDKYDATTSYMIEQGHATELKNKLKEYREFVINALDEVGIHGYGHNVGLLTDEDANGNKIVYTDGNGSELDWEHKNFENIILTAEIAIANKIVGEIQTTEYDAITELFKGIGATDYKFNSLEARVLPKSTYVLVGQDYEAEVFIAAQDTTTKFGVRYSMGVEKFNNTGNNGNSAKSSGGIVKLKFPATKPGMQNYAGVVEMQDPVTGEIVPYPFSARYTVAPPSATIAPTQMMIFYQGLKNPISVSAPGVANDKIDVTVSNGAKLTKGTEAGTYMVEIQAGVKTVTVTATGSIDGKSVVLGSYNFRVKRVPSPEAQISGVSSGKLAKDDVLAAGGIIPDMGDFEFGDYTYKIVSFKLSTFIGGDIKEAGTNKGGSFNSETRKFIQSARHGQKLFFENIQAQGPDGATRTLNPVNIEIK